MHIHTKLKRDLRSTQRHTHLQQLAALLQSAELSRGTGSHVADEDSRLVSSDYCNIVR